MVWCATVRDDAPVPQSDRPNTKDYPEDARKALGVAVARGREAAGHQWRPSFAKAAKMSLRSLVKLETGEPVGPTVYEAAARALPAWTVDTPRDILEGGQPPEPDSSAERNVAELLRIEAEIERRLRAIGDEFGYEAFVMAAGKMAELSREQYEREAREADNPRDESA